MRLRERKKGNEEKPLDKCREKQFTTSYISRVHRRLKGQSLKTKKIKFQFSVEPKN